MKNHRDYKSMIEKKKNIYNEIIAKISATKLN